MPPGGGTGIPNVVLVGSNIFISVSCRIGWFEKRKLGWRTEL